MLGFLCVLFLAAFSASAKRFHLSRSFFGPFLSFFYLSCTRPSPVPSISPNFTLSLLTFSIYCPPSVIVIRRITGDQREKSRTSTTDLSPRSLSPFSLSGPGLLSPCCVFLFDIVLSALFTAVTAPLTRSSACKQVRSRQAHNARAQGCASIAAAKRGLHALVFPLLSCWKCTFLLEINKVSILMSVVAVFCKFCVTLRCGSTLWKSSSSSCTNLLDSLFSC